MSIESINILAILLSPVIAVVVTLWYQNRREKRNTKLSLFITLMAYRKTTKPTYDWAKSLNLIDIVFADNPAVVKLWHEYHGHLCVDATTQATQHTYLNLLSEMAKELDYKRLQQTDIDTFYRPNVHEKDAQENQELFDQILRVLKNTESICLIPKQGSTSPDIQKQLPEGK